MNVKFILKKGGEPVALMKDMRDTMRITGTWMRDLRNTFQVLKKAIPSIDKERMPDPKSAIKELREIVASILKAGPKNLKKLGNAIEELQGGIDSIKTQSKARAQNVSGSLAEWWLDLKSTLLKLKEAIPCVDKVRLSITESLSCDKTAEIIAGFGIPGFVLVMLMAASPYFGAAAITSSLAALGPFGMLGGIATLGILAFISKALAEFGIDQLLRAVLVKLKENGTTPEKIREEIDNYPISEELKRKLREDIKNFCEEENHCQSSNGDVAASRSSVGC